MLGISGGVPPCSPEPLASDGSSGGWPFCSEELSPLGISGGVPPCPPPCSLSEISPSERVIFVPSIPVTFPVTEVPERSVPPRGLYTNRHFLRRFKAQHKLGAAQLRHKFGPPFGTGISGHGNVHAPPEHRAVGRPYYGARVGLGQRSRNKRGLGSHFKSPQKTEIRRFGGVDICQPRSGICFGGTA